MIAMLKNSWKDYDYSTKSKMGKYIAQYVVMSSLSIIFYVFIQKMDKLNFAATKKSAMNRYS